MAELDSSTEDERERTNRRVGEVLQELRVAMPGVQVLFAFLLTVPFAAGFDDVTQFERDVYLFTLLCAAVSSALFIAPVAYHRLLFGLGEKERLLDFAARAAIVGLIFLALSMSGAILLVTSYLFELWTALLTTGGLVLLFIWLWFIVGAVQRMNARAED